MNTYPVCCNSNPIFLITYVVDNKKIKYNVCTNCSKLDCFRNYIVTKITLSENLKT